MDNTGGAHIPIFPPKTQPKHFLHPPSAASNTSPGFFFRVVLSFSILFFFPPSKCQGKV